MIPVQDILAMALPNGVTILPTIEEHYNCAKCHDSGFAIISREPFMVQECECVQRKANIRRIERSGLKELLDRCSFDSYVCTEEWQSNAKAKAMSYLDAKKGTWFFIGGQSGSGKTHLCTAICRALIDGGHDVLYMKWREAAPRLKAMVNDRESYESEMRRLCDISVLYVDDFWKGSVTDGDINLAYQLINDRYNTGKRTIISSERSIEQIVDIDEAIGGRIYERSRGYCFLNQKVNYRFPRR